MDKIELITQPEKETLSESSQEKTLQKLKDLVSDYDLDTKDDTNEPENRDENREAARESEVDDNDNKLNEHSDLQGKHPHNVVHEHNKKVNQDTGETTETDKKGHEGSIEYDEDGFEIPQGKIPLDGHFSTSEIKELLRLSKEGGILKDDIKIKVLESNETIGDKLVISEESKKGKLNESDGDGKDENNKDESKGEKVDKEDKGAESGHLNQSNSTDPKEQAMQYGKKSQSG